MTYTLTVTETETGSWAVLDNTGRQVWASRWPEMALRTAAEVLAKEAAAEPWLARVPAVQRRSNRARAAAWARIDGRDDDPGDDAEPNPRSIFDDPMAVGS